MQRSTWFRTTLTSIIDNNNSFKCENFTFGEVVSPISEVNKRATETNVNKVEMHSKKCLKRNKSDFDQSQYVVKHWQYELTCDKL